MGCGMGWETLQSASKGNPDAQNELGRMYEDGEGVKQSYVLAAKWYRKAAEHVPDLGGAPSDPNTSGNQLTSVQSNFSPKRSIFGRILGRSAG
jgi:hypothetical protein